MKRSWIVAIALLTCAILAVGAVGAAGKPQPANEATASANCGSGVVCVFTGIAFQGTEGQTNCGAEGAHPLAGKKESGINHCANRAVWFRTNGTAHYCRNAGDQLESAEFNELWIGAGGSHC